MSGHEGSLNAGSDHDAASKQANSNPFDDYDFSQVQKRRERAKQAKENAKDDAEKSLLANADADNPLVAPVNLETGKKVRRHNIIKASNKAYDGGVKERKKTANFFGFGQQMTGDSDTANYEDSVIDLTPINVGNKTLAVWPYDDFHLIQKAYYEKLGETKEQLSTHEEEDAAAAADDIANATGGATSKEKEARQRQQQQQMMEQQSSIPIFSRPPDPPDIPSAVQGLSLTRFEYKAEERAIAIVSTWLFDVGLIDELLVNGGMTGLSEAHYTDDNASVRTSEGVEITSGGNPIEGSTKMDKEITKLRNATKRQLALINARLNDGVAATGSEVQELVSAVAATKDDIGRLRELSSYVSNAGDVEQTDQFMLTKYPKLKQAINARRNLARCFRELDFFAQIPSTCDRLREELHAGEWTAHEWSSLRSVAREHVELEIFLVEAERGMKKRLEGEGEQAKHIKPSRRQSADANFGRNAFRNTGLNNSNALIDRFLEEHVSNVWELGDEIRLRIMSGIASSFDLALNNPAGMVALVEAVEVYETANDDYSAVHGEEAGQDNHHSQTLRFTDMRAAALGELYKDFETRGLDVFRELTTAAADTADEDDVSNKQFSAVLRASNELAAEIGIVKDKMSVCFPDNWSITTLWTTCVAHVCSTNILQQIGGPDGQKLPDLTVTQLLDLVAWVENFREIIEDTFPEIAKMQAKRTYLNQSPKLLQENSKTIDLDAAQDSLAWVNNTLWEVHDLAKDEFLLRTKEQTEGWLRNVYEADHHNKSQTADGRLVTSLCEDVYSLAGVQLRTIRERLTRKSEALVQAVGVIFKNLYEKQMLARDLYLVDFETCCAASNDFLRMSDKCEEIVAEIQGECTLSESATSTLEEQAAAILGLYSSDAVYAAKKTHVYCFEPIEGAISNELFGPEWETELTNNELALTLVRTLDDFMEDLETFLDELMVQKAVEAQISSSVNFYIRCMLQKASGHTNNKKSWFKDNAVALGRMRADAMVMRDYFEGLAETMPTLERVIEKEFKVLESVLELLSIAAGISKGDGARDFILVLQKRVRNVPITKFVVGDLYHLVNPQEERAVYELIDTMEEEMNAVAPTDEQAASSAKERGSVPGLRTDEMMAKHCAESKRHRPLKAGAVELAENALRGWRLNWGGGEQGK